MRRELIHICGPFSIYSYGVAIAFGVLIFAWLMQRDPRYKKLNINNKLIDILIGGIITGVFGGRLLYVLTEPEADKSLMSFLSFWEGGFSVLGAILGILAVMPWFLKKIRVPIIPFLDVVAIYAPLLQSISRVGCFFAGCCYGAITNLPWAMTYTDPNTAAPMHIPLHPTQLYSAIILGFIFLVMYLFLQKIIRRPGQLLMAYLMLSSAERFFVDFWRADRVFIEPENSFLTIFTSILPIDQLSVNQLIALAIIVTSGIIYLLISALVPKQSRL